MPLKHQTCATRSAGRARMPATPRCGGCVLVHRFSCPSSGVITCLFTGTYGRFRGVCSQLLSESDLPENHGCPNLFLPNHWSRHVKSALLHVISLARLACVHTWKWAAGSLGPRIGQEVVADNTRWNRPRKARSFRRLISAAYTCTSQISRPPYSTSTYASCLPRSSPDEEQRKTNPCLLWRRGITISAAGTNTCCEGIQSTLPRQGIRR